MRTLKVSLSIYIALTLLATACQESDSPQRDMASFTSIFDNTEFSTRYFAIDIKQTGDEGYLILAGRLDTVSYRTYTLKADKYGNFTHATKLDDNLINPVGELVKLEDSYYFICKDEKAGEASLVALDSVGAMKTAVTIASNITHPAAAAQDDRNLVVMGYDNENLATVLLKVNTSGNVGGEVSYSIGAGTDKKIIEEAIIDHFTQKGELFPFMVGRAPGGEYYFNGFFNYTLSLCFSNFAKDQDPIGWIAGQQEDGGLSAFTPVAAGKFAGSVFNFGENYLLPVATYSPSSKPTIADYMASPTSYNLRELSRNAKVKILRTTLNEKNVLVYASNTQNRQIGLYFYDEASGNFMSSRYLGFSNPFEIGNLIATSDGGLAICGTTYLAGRFPRLCLFKLSKDEAAAQVKM